MPFYHYCNGHGLRGDQTGVANNHDYIRKRYVSTTDAPSATIRPMATKRKPGTLLVGLGIHLAMLGPYFFGIFEQLETSILTEPETKKNCFCHL